MLLLLSIAQAQSNDYAIADAACQDVYIAGVLPAVGAIDVPLDILPIAIIGGDCGGFSWAVSLEDADGVVLAEQEISRHAVTGSVRMEPGFELEPYTEYTLRWSAVDGWDEFVHSFVTGEHLTQGASSPTVGSLDAIATGNDVEGWLITGQIDVQPGDDADALQVLHLLNDEGAAVFSALPEDGVATLSLPSSWLDRAPAEVCAVVAQDDGAGVRETLDEVCVAPELVETEPAGRLCSTAPAGGLLASLLGLAVARRRRRQA